MSPLITPSSISCLASASLNSEINDPSLHLTLIAVVLTRFLVQWVGKIYVKQVGSPDLLMKDEFVGLP